MDSTESMTPAPPEREHSGPVPAPDPAISPPSYRRTLANRSFRLLWIAQLVSQSGDFIFEVALIWYVLQLTGSPFAVGILVTGTVLPGVLLGPLLGVYIDRWDRRRTLLITNLVQGFVVAVLGALVLLGLTNLPILFVIVLGLGTAATIVRVATTAYVPSVVHRDDLASANGLMSASGAFNQIIGLSLGGVFVAAFGVTLPIQYDALTFFVAAGLLILIPKTVPNAAAKLAEVRSSVSRELREGLSFIRAHRFMLEIIAVALINNFFGNGLVAIIAPYAEFNLHGGAAVYGFLGAAVAAGALVGALAMGRANLHRSAGLYVFAGAFVFGPLVILLGLTSLVPIALALFGALGIALSVTNLPVNVVFQAKIPARLLGRVLATFGALVSAMAPIGPIFAGWFAEQTSVSDFFFLAGGAITVAIGVGALFMRDLRTLRY